VRVVSNTSPLCHAVWIGEADILPALFGRVIIPGRVAEELASEGAPQSVRSWIAQPPGWLEVQKVELEDTPPLPARLHRGELEALFLGRKLNADLVLLDERAARRAAEALGLKVMGLLGILDQAARRGWLNFSSALERLVATDFYLAPQLVETFLRRHEE
jgi:predicted nucleic acid-binding protein